MKKPKLQTWITGVLCRSLFVGPVLLGLALCHSTFAAQPNIVVIVADDLGYGELSCQGFTAQVPTPHIDSIGTNGVRFTNGYVSGPYCSPTRAGLMTGRYQQRFGHEFNPGLGKGQDKNMGLSITETTLGDHLKAAGYATGWFGKSHLGYEPRFHPLQRGFDEYFGFLSGSHSYLDSIELKGEKAVPILDGTTEVKKYGHTTEAFGQHAVSYIEKHCTEPWLVYLPFNAVHGPLQSTEKYLSRFASVTDPDRRTFCAMLSAMDDAVGAVLAKIRERKLEENTLIFFFSDNGGPTFSTTSGNGPLRGFKGETWEGGIRVPFLVQWKEKIPAGKVDDRPVIQLDIHATALAAAGVEAKPEWKLEGVNLLPYLSGETITAPHDMLYWRFGQQIALRAGDWKLVKAYGMTGIERGSGAGTTADVAVYNLKEDIGEKNNVAAQQPEKLKELSAAWDRWNMGNVPASWGGDGDKAAAKKQVEWKKAAKP